MKYHSVAATLIAALLCCWTVSINPTASASMIEGEDATSKMALQTVNIVLPMGSEEAWERIEVDFQIDADTVAPRSGQEDLLRQLDVGGVLPIGLQEMSAWTYETNFSEGEESLKAKMILDLEKHSLLLYIGDELVFIGSTMMLAEAMQNDELHLQLHLVPLTEGISEVPSPGAFSLLAIAGATVSGRRKRPSA